MMIDLHGYSIPIARAAVRSALYMLKSEAKIDLELAAAEGECMAVRVCVWLLGCVMFECE